MIITKLKGGLGNQMFQYAAGLALAEHHRTIFKLDVSWFQERPGYEAHNRYGLSCFNITEQFATSSEIERFEAPTLTRTEKWSVALARALHFYRYARAHTHDTPWHCPPDAHHYPEFSQLPDGTALDGYFQSEKFFTPVADLLRLHFTFRYPAPPAVMELAERIRSKPSIALHFRRGDYARNPTFARELGVLDLGYYERALALLRERAPDATLYIFSDDIEAVAREFSPPGPHEFVRCVKPWHAYDKIRLMSLCDHIAIANSSFSWWGAWLNQNPEKLVVAPDPWFTGSPLDPADIVPVNWTRIHRSA